MDIEKMNKVMGWRSRLNKMREEEVDYKRIIIAAFLFGAAFGMVLVQFIIPFILQYLR